MKIKTKSKKIWFMIALVAFMAAAPHATVLRDVSQTMNPHLLNAWRFGLAAIVTLPWVLKRNKKLTRNGLMYSLLAGFGLTISAVTFIYALATSQASYVNMLLLLSPAFLMVYSIKLDGEKVRPSALTGFFVAAVGALVMTAFPLIFSNKNIPVFPVATTLLIINAAVYPLVTMSYKWATVREKIPLPIIICISTGMVSVVSLVLWGISGHELPASLTGQHYAALIYSGVVVICTAKLVTVAAFRFIGASAISVLTYLETFVAVLLSVLILKETITPTMIAGGLIILLGVIIVQQRVSAKRASKQFRHHLRRLSKNFT